VRRYVLVSGDLSGNPPVKGRTSMDLIGYLIGSGAVCAGMIIGWLIAESKR
jgi:hypothetical protein